MTANLTTASARTEREIALMHEYGTRLTADLLTGNPDMREAAAKLPSPNPPLKWNPTIRWKKSKPRRMKHE